MKLCEKCGYSYYRRNLLECWTGRAPGSRTGWVKTEMKLCNTCLPTVQAQRMFIVSGMRLTKTGRVVKLKKTA